MSPFQKAAERKLIISSLCQGTHGLWHCYIRDKREKLVGTSFGCSSAEEAVTAALRGKAFERPTPAHQFEDLLG